MSTLTATLRSSSGVVGGKDHAHPPGAQLVEDDVAADERAPGQLQKGVGPHTAARTHQGDLCVRQSGT